MCLKPEIEVEAAPSRAHQFTLQFKVYMRGLYRAYRGFIGLIWAYIGLIQGLWGRVADVHECISIGAGMVAVDVPRFSRVSGKVS